MPDKPIELSSPSARRLNEALTELAERNGQQFRSLTTLLVGLAARFDNVDARLDAIDVRLDALDASVRHRAGP